MLVERRVILSPFYIRVLLKLNGGRRNLIEFIISFEKTNINFTGKIFYLNLISCVFRQRLKTIVGLEEQTHRLSRG